MNDFTIKQAAAVLNDVVQQATGQKAIANIASPEDFIAVAQTALKTGRDPVMNALSQVWSRTIFAARPYSGKFQSLEMDIDRYGNALRKLSPVAQQMTNDERFTWPVAYDAAQTQNPLGNGQSVDMYKINKQDVLQTNFYGTAVYHQGYTIFKDQFDTAFSSADEFMRFNSMNATERLNDKESYREAVARGLQANLIGALLDEKNNDRVIHALTEYNTQTGEQLTAQDVYKPANFPTFVRWLYARIASIVRLMGERSQLFQTVVDGKAILRHSSPENLRVAMLGQYLDQFNTLVNSGIGTFNDDYLKLPTYEGIAYWQNIETPDSIALTPVYTGTDGSVKKAEAEVEQAGIIGVIHDRDAIGYCYTNTWSAATPLNTRGGYWNEDYHATIKTISDVTEKACVIVLD